MTEIKYNNTNNTNKSSNTNNTNKSSNNNTNYNGQFKLPISYVKYKQRIDSSIIDDLELHNTSKEPSLYNYVFDSKDRFKDGFNNTFEEIAKIQQSSSSPSSPTAL